MYTLRNKMESRRINMESKRENMEVIRLNRDLKADTERHGNHKKGHSNTRDRLAIPRKLTYTP